MKINKMYLSIVVLIMILFSLSGCIKVTLKNQSEQIESTESSASDDSAKVAGIATTETMETTKKNEFDAKVTTEAVFEPSTEAKVKSNTDVFEEVFEFDLPANYQLLDDEYYTKHSRMYALSKRGKIVATIFLNYVDTDMYKDEDVLKAYDKELHEKYNIIGTSEVSNNGINWIGYVGTIKDEENRNGYVHLSCYHGDTVYIEVMCTDEYESALDVATVIKSFKYKDKASNNKENKEEAK